MGHEPIASRCRSELEIFHVGGTRAKLKCLATEKARFKLLRVWHGYPRRRVRQCAPGFILLLACPMREEVDYGAGSSAGPCEPLLKLP